jgi:hypothetical protein
MVASVVARCELKDKQLISRYLLKNPALEQYLRARLSPQHRPHAHILLSLVYYLLAYTHSDNSLGEEYVQVQFVNGQQDVGALMKSLVRIWQDLPMGRVVNQLNTIVFCMSNGRSLPAWILGYHWTRHPFLPRPPHLLEYSWIGLMLLMAVNINCFISESNDVIGNTIMSKSTCSLCLDQMSNSTCTPCGHVYCWKCIHYWCQSHPQPQCPTCRSPLRPSQLLSLSNY